MGTDIARSARRLGRIGRSGSVRAVRSRGVPHGGGVRPIPLILIAAPDGVHPGLVGVTSGEGYETLVVHSGESALRALYKHRPDLLILSLRLGGLSPWEVLSRVRDMSDLPIAVVDGSFHVGDAVRALNSGADDYVTAEVPQALYEPLLRARLRRATGGGVRGDGVHELDRLLVHWPVMVVLAVVSVTPFILWGPVYRRDHVPDASFLKYLVWGVALWLYAYHLFIVSARGFVRMLRGRNGWAKTRRNAEPLMVGPAARET